MLTYCRVAACLRIGCECLQVAWEHEQFSRQRITAATLSQLEEAPELFERTGGIADSRYNFVVLNLTVGEFW